MPRKVLIAGAGVAGLEAALALKAIAEDQIEVELVAPATDFVYRPLAVAAPFRLGEAQRFPLARLAERAKATLTHGAVLALHPHRRTVEISDSGEREYDLLLLALGAKPVEGLPGALTFRGPGDEGALSEMLRDVREGRARRVVFTMPIGISWPLPVYELALLTAVHLSDSGVDAEITLVTPEPRPLQLFGSAASDAVAELLELHGIRLLTDTAPNVFEEGTLRFIGTGSIEADRVVALPRIEGPRLPGTPQDANGFVPTDEHGRVLGLDDVFAAGDLTDFPVKQGGLAAQQADAAAEAIAASAGVSITPTAFTPVLRGLLLTGLTPRFMRSELGSLESETDTEPLWWPPGKIVGRHLGPFLASHLDFSTTPPRIDAVKVEVELDRGAAGAWASV